MLPNPVTTSNKSSQLDNYGWIAVRFCRNKVYIDDFQNMNDFLVVFSTVNRERKGHILSNP